MSCPICQRPTVRAYRPFCSKRCADVDLGRWMTGGYALPSDEEPEEGGTPHVPDADRPPRPN